MTRAHTKRARSIARSRRAETTAGRAIAPLTPRRPRTTPTDGGSGLSRFTSAQSACHSGAHARPRPAAVRSEVLVARVQDRLAPEGQGFTDLLCIGQRVPCLEPGMAVVLVVSLAIGEHRNDQVLGRIGRALGGDGEPREGGADQYATPRKVLPDW